MSRRSNRQEDSLEMLLDTMCNAFGGLILIAILIAILARTADVEPGLEEQANLLVEIGKKSRLEREAKELQGKFTNINERVEAINPGITNIMEELTILIAEAARKSELVKDVEETAGKTDDIETDTTDLTERNDALAEEIRKANRDKDRLEMEIEEAKDRKAVKVRPPNAQVVQLEPIIVVLMNGKFWAIHTFEGRNKKLNLGACNIQRDVDGNAQKLKLKPEIGKAVPGNLAQLNASPIGGYFRLFPKEKYLCKLYVHRNSFKEARLLMNMIIKRGIRYNWTPDPRDEIEFAIGAGGPERAQ